MSPPFLCEEAGLALPSSLEGVVKAELRAPDPGVWLPDHLPGTEGDGASVQPLFLRPTAPPRPRPAHQPLSPHLAQLPDSILLSAGAPQASLPYPGLNTPRSNAPILSRVAAQAAQ